MKTLHQSEAAGHAATAEKQPAAAESDALVGVLTVVVERLVDARVAARLAELGIVPGEVDPIVKVSLPVSRSRQNALCRAGAIAGAKKIGRSWVAPRSSVDAFVAALPVPTRKGPPPPARTRHELDAELDALGFDLAENDGSRRAGGT